MGAYNDIFVKKVFTAEVVAASGNTESEIIDLGGVTTNPESFGLQVELTGDGTATFEALVSNHADDFIRPSTQPVVKSGFTKTSGPGSDGKDAFGFSIVPSRFLKIKVTETGTSDSITVTAYLATN